ncbi:hypothetical protein AVEN_31061-1 [Araneus ventricosus]|uniref:Uncharacterized protein n=1 Tax=Araneus ventricosus TaxID=182803 RepID=A0A4Y2GHN1_ARAVE|nr:hypothetical protein AVEN_31061-1 [Araneus ventricosus]
MGVIHFQDSVGLAIKDLRGWSHWNRYTYKEIMRNSCSLRRRSSVGVIHFSGLQLDSVKISSGLRCKVEQRSAHQLPSSHCGRSSQVVPNGSTLPRSASISLLARTADRTQKTFAQQGDPSRPIHYLSSKRSSYIVFPAGRDVTWNDLAHSWRIFSPNRDIEKIPAPLRSHIPSPKSPRWSPSLSPKSGVQTWLLSVISYLPL